MGDVHQMLVQPIWIQHMMHHQKTQRIEEGRVGGSKVDARITSTSLAKSMGLHGQAQAPIEMAEQMYLQGEMQCTPGECI